MQFVTKKKVNLQHQITKTTKNQSSNTTDIKAKCVHRIYPQLCHTGKYISKKTFPKRYLFMYSHAFLYFSIISHICSFCHAHFTSPNKHTSPKGAVNTLLRLRIKNLLCTSLLSKSNGAKS